MKFYILALYGEVIKNAGWTHLSCNTKLLLSLLKGHKSALRDTTTLHLTLDTTHCALSGCGSHFTFSIQLHRSYNM